MLLLCCCCSCCLFIHLGRSSCRRISWHGEEDRTIKINKWKENTQTRRRCNAAAGGSACKNIVFYGDVQGRAGAPAAPESVQNEPTNEWMDGWTNKSLLISCAKPFATRILLLLVLPPAPPPLGMAPLLLDGGGRLKFISRIILSENMNYKPFTGIRGVSFFLSFSHYIFHCSPPPSNYPRRCDRAMSPLKCGRGGGEEE